jgi:hypothetical protein
MADSTDLQLSIESMTNAVEKFAVSREMLDTGKLSFHLRMADEVLSVTFLYKRCKTKQFHPVANCGKLVLYDLLPYGLHKQD